MTLVVRNPRPATPDQMRGAVTELSDALRALPDHHDFAEYAAFEVAFMSAIDGLEASFRTLCKGGRITRSDDYCTVDAFGRVASSKMGLIGAVEKWLRIIERGLKEA